MSLYTCAPYFKTFSESVLSIWFLFYVLLFCNNYCSLAVVEVGFEEMPFEMTLEGANVTLRASYSDTPLERSVQIEFTIVNITATGNF